MRRVVRQSGFSLVEMLLVVAVIALLVGMAAPALRSARLSAKKASCLANLHGLALAASTYLSENGDHYWAYSDRGTHYWGSGDRWPDEEASPLLAYCGYNARLLECPSMQWGSYVPAGGASEPTSTYGYNAWCLDPATYGRHDAHGAAMQRMRLERLSRPSELFVFGDAASFRVPGGVRVLQNSLLLDPIMLDSRPNYAPNTHFRHVGLTNALSADGHAEAYDTEGGALRVPMFGLGFVGMSNAPHYDNH